jgi:hypothetical protein
MSLASKTDSSISDIRWLFRIVRKGPRDLAMIALGVVVLGAGISVHEIPGLHGGASIWLQWGLTIVACLPFGLAIRNVARQFLPPPPPQVDKPSAIRGPLPFTRHTQPCFRSLKETPKLHFC